MPLPFASSGYLLEEAVVYHKKDRGFGGGKSPNPPDRDLSPRTRYRCPKGQRSFSQCRKEAARKADAAVLLAIVRRPMNLVLEEKRPGSPNAQYLTCTAGRV